MLCSKSSLQFNYYYSQTKGLFFSSILSLALKEEGFFKCCQRDPSDLSLSSSVFFLRALTILATTVNSIVIVIIIVTSFSNPGEIDKIYIPLYLFSIPIHHKRESCNYSVTTCQVVLMPCSQQDIQLQNPTQYLWYQKFYCRFYKKKPGDKRVRYK